MNFTKEVAPLVEALEEGNLILYPTETIWGIGCDATNPTAIAKLDALKKRKESKNYILLVDSQARLSEYIDYIPPKASNLIAYHTRPLTIVYDKPKNLPTSLLAEDGSIAIRVTLDPFCKELVNAFGKPIVSTSANISGEPYPKTFLDIPDVLRKGVASIAQYKQYEESGALPSVLVRVVDGADLVFLRK
jgi:L-threonylcarbamoyladenylate synthase